MRDEIWDDLANWRKDKKADRRARMPAAIKLLQESGRPFEVKNDGEHYIIEKRLDWWPASGVWIARGVRARGVGIISALGWIRKHPT